ncbi:MAG: IS21 family transposase, partial [Myxococcales bacterium]|nr:IS21 family transposase [Myxococcales bacterium]
MKRTDMRRIREVLRLHQRGLSHRAISTATGLAKGTVYAYLSRAAAAEVTWELASELDDVALDQKLFKAPGRNMPASR